MALVMVCWAVAMVAGISWSRVWTAVCTAVAVVGFLTLQASTLAGGDGWVQLAVLVLSPWWLAMVRAQYERRLKTLQAEEAQQMVDLSQAARGLLSLQTSSRQLETQMTELTDVYHVTKETSRALRLEELFAASLGIAPRLLNAPALRLIELSDESPRLLRAKRLSDGRMVPSDGGQALLAVEEAILKQVSASGKPTSATAEELSCELPPGSSRVAWAPLWREQKPIGVLVADELPEEQLKTLAIVANQLSLQLSRIYLYQQVESLAVTDALTGLYVRRHFLERAKEEVARSSRHGLSCTLLMADLDEFKQKNDTYGHLVGDAILRDVAQLLTRNLRTIDLLARFGGEEFIMLLIETTKEQAIPIAQRLRQLVEVHSIRAYDEVVTQTISMGVASFPQDAPTLETLIEQADQALYMAKHAGRNRVVCASTPQRPRAAKGAKGA